MAHFLAQTDLVGRAMLVILLVMSVASWYLIVTKALQGWLERKRSERFLESFWAAPSIGAVHTHLEEHHPDALDRTRQAQELVSAWQIPHTEKLLVQAVDRHQRPAVIGRNIFRPAD